MRTSLRNSAPIAYNWSEARSLRSGSSLWPDSTAILHTLKHSREKTGSYTAGTGMSGLLAAGIFWGDGGMVDTADLKSASG
jgi:hypothetical protein